MNPGDQRLDQKPGQQKDHPNLGNKNPYQIETGHGTLPHRAHQVVQTQRESPQRAENGNRQNSVQNRIDDQLSSTEVARIDSISQPLIVHQGKEDNEGDQQDGGNDNQPANERGRPHVTAVRVALFAQGKATVEHPGCAYAEDSCAEHDKVNGVIGEPEEFATEDRSCAKSTRWEVLIVGEHSP